MVTHIRYVTLLGTEAPELIHFPECLVLDCGRASPAYAPRAEGNGLEELFIELEGFA